MLRYLLPAVLSFLMCQCAPTGGGGSSFDRRMTELEAEHNADIAATKAGTLSKKDFTARVRGRVAELDRMEAEIQRQDRAAAILAKQRSSDADRYSYASTLGGDSKPRRSRYLLPSRRSNVDYDYPSFTSRSRPRGSSSIFESDYGVGKTLGGSYQSTNRITGRSTTLERPLGGGYRTTSSSGYSVDWDQNLGGSYSGRDSRGSSWSTGQNLSGQRTVTGSNGSTYTREQTLGGGYKWTSD